MAIADEWKQVIKQLDTLSVYKVVHPTLNAMRKVVGMIKDDPAFAELHPRPMHAALVLSTQGPTYRGPTRRRVYVGWTDDQYIVAFLDPGLEFSERTSVREDGVMRVIRKYVDRLEG